MNTFNEDEYAYKIHFSNNFDCDSDSDNKSDFDDWYYKHKPPPTEIYDCDIVKIEPFTTVLYKKSISKVNGNSQKKIKSKRTLARTTKNVSDLNRKTQVFSESNKPNREGTTLTNLSGYRENKPNEIPKKKRNRKKKNEINKAKPFDLSSIEWPTLDGVQSPLESKSDSVKKNVNSSFRYNNKDTKVLTELSQKCDNNVPVETKRLESIKNINGKSITETRFLLLDEYEKQSFLKFPERLQNTPKLNNANKNKVTCNSKENLQKTAKSKSEAKERPLFGKKKESIVPNKNSKMKCKKSVNPTKQPDHSVLKREVFNLSSFEWPSLHSATAPSFTYKIDAQQISKNMELKKGHHTNSLRQNGSAHFFKDQINFSSIPAEVHQRQQQSKKKLKSQKSKPISDDAICSISNKSSSVKDKHNQHGSFQLNEQMEKNISQIYCNINASGSLELESCNGFWCLDNGKNSIFTTNQSYCKSIRRQSHKEILKSKHSYLYNDKLSSCSSKNMEKPKQSKVSTKINIQSTVKKEGSLNLSTKEETLVQPEALQSRTTSESSMRGLHIGKSNEVAYHLSLHKSDKKDKPTDTCLNKEKPKKKQSGTNSSPSDEKSGSVSLDKNHNHILCNSTGCNEVKQLETEEKANKSVSSKEKNSHLLNNVHPKENLGTGTVVNVLQLTKRKKKKPNQISELNLSPYDETKVSELKEIKQKKTEKGLELNNSVHTEKIVKMHTLPNKEKASTVNAEFQHLEKQSKKGLSKCVAAVDKKDEASRSHDKEYPCISKIEQRSKKQANMKCSNENTIKSPKKEDKDPLWPRGFLLPLFKQKSKKLANQSMRPITPPSSSNKHTDDIIFSKNGKLVSVSDFKGTLDDTRLDCVIPLNTFVTGGKDFFLIDKLFLRSPFLICAKPRLGVCNVLLHFYTGYQNDKENIFDKIMSIDDYLIDTFM